MYTEIPKHIPVVFGADAWTFEYEVLRMHVEMFEVILRVHHAFGHISLNYVIQQRRM